MACGCPVVLSNVSSLPEVGGEPFDVDDPDSAGAALYFDPLDVDEIAHQLETVLTLDDTQIEKLKQNALQRARLFRWRDVASKVWRTLQEEFT